MIKKKTKISLEELARRIDLYRAEVVGFKVDSNEKFEKLESRISLLPTKEEYFESQSKLMGELKKSREVQETTQDLYDTVTKRIEVIDKKLGIDSLATAF